MPTETILLKPTTLRVVFSPVEMKPGHPSSGEIKISKRSTLLEPLPSARLAKLERKTEPARRIFSSDKKPTSRESLLKIRSSILEAEKAARKGDLNRFIEAQAAWKNSVKTAGFAFNEFHRNKINALWKECIDRRVGKIVGSLDSVVKTRPLHLDSHSLKAINEKPTFMKSRETIPSLIHEANLLADHGKTEEVLKPSQGPRPGLERSRLERRGHQKFRDLCRKINRIL
jgi:hypothetical protein